MIRTLSQIQNKNIAVGLFGISYQNNYHHWMGWKTNPDWRKTNYKDSLNRLLIENNNNIEHFLSTYHHELENELLLDFNPTKYKFNNFEKGSWVYYRHLRFQEVLNLFSDIFDYYIVTRFDLSFNYDILYNCKISDYTINVTSKHGVGEDTELQCDYFYMFDRTMLQVFRDFIINLPQDNGDICYYHKLHRYDNTPTFSYMIDGSYYSHNCPVWHIVR